MADDHPKEKGYDHIPSDRVKPADVETEVGQCERQEPCEMEDDKEYNHLSRGQADQCEPNGTKEKAPDEQGAKDNTNRRTDFARERLHLADEMRLWKKAASEVSS